MGAEYSIEHFIEPATEPATEPAIGHSTPKKRYLTRDEGVQILAFRRFGMTYEAIAKQFHNVSPYQVERIIHKGHSTSTKRPGRPPFITDEQSTELIAFVCASRHNR